MAFGLLQNEKFNEVGVIIVKCFKKYKLLDPPNKIPFEYPKYNHIISHTYVANGRAVDAIKACKESARLGEICSGATHPMTLHVRYSMANHLYLAGMVDESLKEALIILQAIIQVVGGVNHFTLESHSMCGSLYVPLGMLNTLDYHFVTCLDPHKKFAWDEECIARARFLYSDVLRRLGREKETYLQLELVRALRDECLIKYPQWLKEDPNNELVVFDQMTCL
ncbi:hypothetical protein BU24DRAFT_458211 [Aaosphaeria arxii CBS 175.79]|uniref:TPR-like protein n=1 Tax=Aaosphaeria arxii CBS 175.79 TaxID=1450172 RepID=A0A6A5YCK9_9PLEO|nr:uncharacterized protein BU24DRAFT_458211 [Aaosphaeria arxii CBS 175.79]KAF2022354.1 hypothetical protein BU24DRAFT_458211 [Aaosphaeria arxii CBS 175.79]